ALLCRRYERVHEKKNRGDKKNRRKPWITGRAVTPLCGGTAPAVNENRRRHQCVENPRREDDVVRELVESPSNRQRACDEALYKNRSDRRARSVPDLSQLAEEQPITCHCKRNARAREDRTIHRTKR